LLSFIPANQFTPVVAVQDEGDIPTDDEKLVEGSRNIIFENVHFNYPARADVNVSEKIF
jgi:hypothetical protein